jgi:NAD(P)-dependent dehydrogenase (short-subunit alcohol dehydrogenase family)
MNIIITGASKGFGKSLAEQFALNGHNLYLCSRNEALLFFRRVETRAEAFALVRVSRNSSGGFKLTGFGVFLQPENFFLLAGGDTRQ